jgi:hypothetical protein
VQTPGQGFHNVKAKVKPKHICIREFPGFTGKISVDDPFNENISARAGVYLILSRTNFDEIKKE